MVDFKRIRLQTYKVNGLVQMLISFCFVLYHADTLYAYKYILALYTFMYPYWVLITNIIFGLIGFYIGIRTFKNRIKIWQSYFWIFSILISGVLLDIISVGWLYKNEI